jgi:ubiquinone/menaquinone biosynthesis C-methylase UbiE
MNQRQLEQLAQQKDNWNKYSAGWRKWDEVLMTTMRPIADSLIDSLNLTGNEHVLDVASGTGEPGLTLSTLLPNGKVTGSDLSENMVVIANQHAQDRGINNYRSQQCDATNMPFADNGFDHIICRFGIMFFPDIEGGLREMIRVLKPGGRLSVAVWAAPEHNSFITLIAKTVIDRLNLPKPSSETPGIFRCAQAGLTSRLLTSAGLSGVTEYNLNGEAIYDSPENYWDIFSDVAGPIMQALNNEPQEVIDEVKTEVIEKAGKLLRNNKVITDWQAIIASGIKKS